MALQTDLPMFIKVYNDIRKFEFHHYCHLTTAKTAPFAFHVSPQAGQIQSLDSPIHATSLSNLKKIYFPKFSQDYNCRLASNLKHPRPNNTVPFNDTTKWSFTDCLQAWNFIFGVCRHSYDIH
jgi:hypothetical protein